MSVPVPLERLPEAIAERGPSAYLLTVSDDGSPHAVHVPLQWEGDEIAVDVGRRSAANATVRPSVSLLFPVRREGDYSLIVDGTAIAAGAGAPSVRIVPTRAVLHRPAIAPDPSASGGADCVPLFPSSRSGA